MRGTTAARLERLFAVVLAAGAAGVCALACGGKTPAPAGIDAGTPSFPGCPPRIVTVPAQAPEDGGFGAGVFFDCTAICGDVGPSCSVLDAGPPMTVSCSVECGGRRPAGLCIPRSHAPPLGAYFVRLAQLEAASVPAFRRMARELSRFGAPRRLVKAAERAAREEMRHARGAASLAKRYGAKPASFTADVRGERSLEAFATENAIEGCVRETYGALVATWQAREAGDPLVRAHMARIAKEETTHAALAWRADAWARGKLAKDARARVEAARANAMRHLIDEVSAAPGNDVTAIAGVPTAIVARRLAFDLMSTLA